MKLVLSTIDNKHKINFDGIVTIIPIKTGLTRERTLGGKQKIRWRGEYNAISITFNYLTSEDYNELLYMWSQSTREVVLTSDRGVYTGLLVDDRIQLNSQRDNKGILFYNGTINMEE